MDSSNKTLSPQAQEELLNVLKKRFEKNRHRHQDIQWSDVLVRLQDNADKLWSLYEMERTGGEPDVVDYYPQGGEYVFYDCAPESPAGRRSLCYDREGLDLRKEHKPENNAMDMAQEMGVKMLTEGNYRYLQTLGKFDRKTSSWIQTPPNIRALGGALFVDYRYDTIFVYHNGAQSYYAARAFRALLKV